MNTSFVQKMKFMYMIVLVQFIDNFVRYVFFMNFICRLYTVFQYFFNMRTLFMVDIMTSICSLFKVGLPDEKGEHCEVKKEEKIEPSKYIDVLIQIQHSVNVHYTTHNIPSQDAGCGLGIGEGVSLVCSRYK